MDFFGGGKMEIITTPPLPFMSNFQTPTMPIHSSTSYDSITHSHVTHWASAIINSTTHDLRGELLLDPIPTLIPDPSILLQHSIAAPSSWMPRLHIIAYDNQPSITPTLFRQYFNHHHIPSSHCQCHQI